MGLARFIADWRAVRALLRRRVAPFIFCCGLAMALSMAGASSARACTTDDMLDLIGSIEAPQGYGQVYGGSVIRPPQPLPTMTVAEVRDWQRRSVAAGSISSAAGRYQIIGDTMDNLISQGVLDPNERFDASAQDRAGRHLLQARGYRDGETSAAVGNALAREWASLPLLSGAGAGRSAYEGIAGNHALIDAESFAAFMACEATVDQMTRLASAARGAIMIGASFDKLVQDLADLTDAIFEALTPWILNLLLAFIVIEIVVSVGRGTLAGEPLQAQLGHITLTLLIGFLIYVLVQGYADVMDAIARLTYQSRAMEGAYTQFGLGAYAGDKARLLASLAHSARSQGPPVMAMVMVMNVINLIMTALIMGVIVMGYAKFFVTAAGGSILMAWGGARATRAESLRYAAYVFGAGLRLMAMLLLLGISFSMLSELRASGGPLAASCVILLGDILLFALLLGLPASVAKLVTFRGAAA